MSQYIRSPDFALWLQCYHALTLGFPAPVLQALGAYRLKLQADSADMRMVAVPNLELTYMHPQSRIVILQGRAMGRLLTDDTAPFALVAPLTDYEKDLARVMGLIVSEAH